MTIRPPFPGAAVADVAPMHILVVDDLADNRDLLISLIDASRLGVCLEAADGRAAIDLLKRGERVDLILLDINMPGLNGYEVLQYLQGHRQYCNIPIIMVTAQNDRESAVHCIQAGASDYIAKPVEESLLRARVRNCLERKRLHDREADLLAAVQSEKDRSEALLFNILPRSVAERLKGGETRIADSLEMVTVLFMDLAGFTEFARRQRADDLVRFLDTLYAEFDRLSHLHGVEKIKTMGDGYMAVSGIASGQDDHAQRCLAFGRAAIGATAELCRTAAPGLALRVGMCSGPVVAGVLGTLRSSFDIWGDTVNIAYRMQEHGQPDCILMAPASHALVAPLAGAERLPPISVKGVGEMEPWLVRCG
jgi:class 3 adenylate cyclase